MFLILGFNSMFLILCLIYVILIFIFLLYVMFKKNETWKKIKNKLIFGVVGCCPHPPHLGVVLLMRWRWCGMDIGVPTSCPHLITLIYVHNARSSAYSAQRQTTPFKAKTMFHTKNVVAMLPPQPSSLRWTPTSTGLFAISSIRYELALV